MNKYLENLASGLKNYSLSLEKKTVLVDKPWSLVDEDGKLQRLIFKRNNELILSKEGQATIGKWEYIPAAKSLLIDRVSDKILLNEYLVFDGLLLLKKDGTNSDLVVLCNENEIPDLDPVKYLRGIRRSKLNMRVVELDSGRMLEIHDDIDIITYPQSASDKSSGSRAIPRTVTIDAERIEDGIYYAKHNNKKYVVKDSKMLTFFWQVRYKLKNGQEIVIDQDKYPYKYVKGDTVWKFVDKLAIKGPTERKAPDELIEDGNYRIVGGRTITCKNGKIVKKSWF